LDFDQEARLDACISYENPKTKGFMSPRAYVGDTKTLLAFNLLDKTRAKDLAGFTIECRSSGQPPYFLHNTLQFRTPGDHAQDTTEPANSSINAPFSQVSLAPRTWLGASGSEAVSWEVHLHRHRQVLRRERFAAVNRSPLIVRKVRVKDVLWH
jgi:hypothetical protein